MTRIYYPGTLYSCGDKDAHSLTSLVNKLDTKEELCKLEEFIRKEKPASITAAVVGDLFFVGVAASTYFSYTPANYQINQLWFFVPLMLGAALCYTAITTGDIFLAEHYLKKKLKQNINK